MNMKRCDSSLSDVSRHNKLRTTNTRIISLCFLLVTLVACSASKDDRGYRVKVGQTAPDIDLIYPGGNTIPLRSLRGKVVMLQFTASWCGVCREEMPHIEKEIWQTHKADTNFVLLGIDLQEDSATVARFRESTGITYPLLLDPEGKAFYTYAQQGAGVTRNVIIAPDGKIAFLTRLYDEQEFNNMKEVINKLLNMSNNSYNPEFMKKAISLAVENVKHQSGGPFGAVIVKDGKIIASSGNTVVPDNDPTAHAEVNAIRRACKALGTFQLTGCDIYTSCEPCPMCLGAIYWARLERVYYACTKDDAADGGFDDSFIYKEIALNGPERTIPFENHRECGAGEEFRLWKAAADKVAY